MPQIPSGSNFFSVVESHLGVEGISALYERAGWKCHLYESGTCSVETDWADLVLEAETTGSLLLHGCVADVEERGSRVVKPLREAGVQFRAEGYSDDSDRRLLREWRSRIEFDIHPNLGAGPLVYGMTKGEVGEALGSPRQEFVRDPQFSPGCTEWIYGESEVFVGFDDAGKCESIMLCPPAGAILDGLDLLGVSGRVAFDALQRLDPSAVIEDDAFVSRKLGIAIGVPDVGTEEEDLGTPPQYVLTCPPGYLPPEEQMASVTFLRIRVRGDCPPDAPHVTYCELNAEQMEVRKVEVFGEGECGWASADESARSTRLGGHRIPALGDLKKDPRFAVSTVTKTDFEQVWSHRATGWPPRSPTGGERHA